MILLEEEKCGWHIRSHYYEEWFWYNCSLHTSQPAPPFIMRLTFFRTGAPRTDEVLALFILNTVSELKVLLVTKNQLIICRVTTMTVTKQTLLESTPFPRQNNLVVWVPSPHRMKINCSFWERTLSWYTPGSSRYWREKWTCQDFKSCV